MFFLVIHGYKKLLILMPTTPPSGTNVP
jgi:hypothetical protein